VHKSTVFTFESFAEMQAALYGDKEDYFYVRDGHPTLEALERELLKVEPADFAMVFSSGMAAISAALLAALNEGDNVIVQKEVYGPTRLIFEEYLSAFGISSTFVDMQDIRAVEKAIQSDTELIYLENPSPFTLRCPDFASIRDLAEKYQLKVMVDNSGAFGIQSVMDYVDLVGISLSKYPAGDSQILGGALLGRGEWSEQVEMARSTLGGVMMPWNAEELIQEMANLSIRLAAVGDTALWMADRLKGHPKVKRVYYPQVIGNKRPFGGLITVEFDLDLMDIPRFIDQLKYFKKGVFWGGTIPVVTPLLASYRVEVLKSWGLSPKLVRFYTGSEDPEKLFADIDQALSF
jgi:cystathionine beta-lyase/cystathionine gamma-synthase